MSEMLVFNAKIPSHRQLKQDKDISKIYNFIVEHCTVLSSALLSYTASYKCGEPSITGEKYLPDCMSAFFINCLLKPVHNVPQ